MSRRELDRGLRAVRRLREVRERDSRLGLVAANGRVLACTAERDLLEQALDAPVATGVSGAALLDERRLLAGTAQRLAASEHQLRAALDVAADARGRWAADRTRTRSIELLLEERAARRAEEAGRGEARESDDIVGTLYGRGRGATEGRR